MRATPRTDPGERNYRTGLLPWVVTFSVAHCDLTYSVEHVLQVYLALSPEPGLLSQISLGQTPFLQALRRTRSPPLLVRVLLRYYGLVRFPAAVHHGCTFFLTTRTLASGQGQQRDLPGKQP